MGIFKRRSRASQAEPTSDPTGSTASDDGRVGDDDHAEQQAVPEQVTEVTTAFDRSVSGPLDRSETGSVADHIDLGALLLRGIEGMQLRLELDAEQSQVVAATALVGASSLQLQPFAAPRSGGLWAQIRDEIAASVVRSGGTAEVADGPYGAELRTRVPSADASGRTVFAPARFLGVDGPRWFLRGVLAGPAAIDEVAAKPLLDFFGQAVVVRGGDPMAPRELLPLAIPQQEEAPQPPSDEEPSPGALSDLNPFERGPEITEVR